MKQGLNTHMLVTIDGIDVEDCEKIEFIFKKELAPNGATIKSATYPNDVTCENDVFRIHWSASETYAVKTGEQFFMDTRITFTGTSDQPETNVVKLVMNPTLFEREG